jgi:hypothetical protein
LAVLLTMLVGCYVSFAVHLVALVMLHGTRPDQVVEFAVLARPTACCGGIVAVAANPNLALVLFDFGALVVVLSGVMG